MRLVFPICESPSMPTLITTLREDETSVPPRHRCSSDSRAYLFCSAPFSPLALDVLGPALLKDVGEDDEADADMCQKRARRKREKGKRPGPQGKERSRKRSAPAAQRGYATATENQPVGGRCRGCSQFRNQSRDYCSKWWEKRKRGSERKVAF